MKNLHVSLRRLWKDRRGQDLLEYALISGFVASAAVAVSPVIVEAANHLSAVVGLLNGALTQNTGL